MNTGKPTFLDELAGSMEFISEEELPEFIVTIAYFASKGYLGPAFLDTICYKNLTEMDKNFRDSYQRAKDHLTAVLHESIVEKVRKIHQNPQNISLDILLPELQKEYQEVVSKAKAAILEFPKIQNYLANHKNGCLLTNFDLRGEDLMKFSQIVAIAENNMDGFLSYGTENSLISTRLKEHIALGQIPLSLLAKGFFKRLGKILEVGGASDYFECVKLASIDIEGYLPIKKLNKIGGYSEVYLAEVMPASNKEKPSSPRTVILKIPRETLDSSHAQSTVEQYESIEQILIYEYAYASGFIPDAKTHFKPIPSYDAPIPVRVGTRKTLALPIEFIEGTDVEDLLCKPELTLEHKLNIIYGCTKAIAYIHDPDHNTQYNTPLVHKDIRPSNFIYCPRDEIFYAIDFGLTSTTKFDKIESGKREYIPPEFFQEQNPDTTWDVYSLGVMTYYILCAQFPFEMPARFSEITITPDIIDKIVTPKTINQNIPAHLSDIVMRCLSYHPSARHQSAIELLNDLDEYRAPSPLPI